MGGKIKKIKGRIKEAVGVRTEQETRRQESTARSLGPLAPPCSATCKT
jgi:uncharacterized protein YjbJ (UPF0337 family)